MKKLVVLGGTGDVYLICALAQAFINRYGPATVITREKFGAVCELFPDVPCGFDEGMVHRGENDRQMQLEYDNRIEHEIFYTHPCFERSRVRVDHLTVKTDVSQADMYRMLLRLPADTPLAMPKVPERMLNYPLGSILLIPDAVSWPNTQPVFWQRLEERLRSMDRNVVVNDPRWNLQKLLRVAASSEWVIGPQCGVMSILATGSFPCRKTFATPSVDHERAPGFLASQTFPYAYVTKFANNDYDVEEFKVSIENRDEIVEAIATGSNARRLTPHNPMPLPAITVSMLPGEVVDRLAVLMVKRYRFPPRRRAAIEREYRRYLEAARTLREVPGVEGLLQQLVIVNEQAFDILERLIPTSMKLDQQFGVNFDLDRGTIAQDSVAAIQLNRKRVDLRRSVDEACGCAVSEVKSYYNPEDNP